MGVVVAGAGGGEARVDTDEEDVRVGAEGVGEEVFGG